MAGCNMMAGILPVRGVTLGMGTIYIKCKQQLRESSDSFTSDIASARVACHHTREHSITMFNMLVILRVHITFTQQHLSLAQTFGRK